MLKISDLNVGLGHQTLNELKKGGITLNNCCTKHLGIVTNDRWLPNLHLHGYSKS